MKTVQLIALLVCCFLCSCGEDKKSGTSNTKATVAEKALASETDTFYLGKKLIRVEKIQKTEFDALPAVVADTLEASHLRRDSLMAKRVADTLFFKTKAKTVAIVNVDKEDDEAAVELYQYAGFIKAINQFLVFGTYYESYNYILIDRETGTQTVLWGRPVPSPDGKFFIVGNSDLQAGFTYNGLQLYTNTHPPRQLGQRELQQWGPEEIKWLDNKTMLARVGVSDTKSENLERTDYFKLTME